MGRPPCCDKTGVKKGPWTPEEDIILVTYIQEHGPGNWRAVPANTGLLRCSKSCRLRWTNYLRPGIKRGNFSDHEEKMIIHLQALLGDRWAAIASYLPERTDNDIKNYWNTYLKKKLKKLQTGLDRAGISGLQPISKGKWERTLQTDLHMARKALCDALSLDKPNSLSQLNTSNGYYSYMSTENISRLLQGWMRNTSKPSTTTSGSTTQNSFNNMLGTDSTSSQGTPRSEANNDEITFESLFGLDSSATTDVSQSVSLDAINFTAETSIFQEESKVNSETQVPLSLLEKWLFDEGGVGHGQEDLIEISLDDTVQLL